MAPAILAGTEPNHPFADAWKEFDKLQKSAKGGGRLGIVKHIAEILIFLVSLGVIEFHPSKNAKQIIAVAFGAILIAELLRVFAAKRRFKHWPCPRCHSEWPGDKKEKDPACTVCGLRLRQLSY